MWCRASVAAAMLIMLASCERAPAPAPAPAPPSAPQALGAGAPSTTGAAVAAPGDAPQEEANLKGRRVTMDLIAARHLAHVWDRGVVIDLGHGSALKYVQGRWKNGWYDAEVEGDHLVAAPKGVGAVMRLPVQAPVEGAQGAWSVQARLKPAGEQRCDVFVSGVDQAEVKIGALALKEGWGIYQLTLPETIKRGAELSVRFHFSKSRELADGKRTAAWFDWVRVGPAGDAQTIARPAQVFDAAKQTLTLQPGQAVSWYTMLSAGEALQASSVRGGAAQVAIARAGGEAEVLSYEGSQPLTLGGAPEVPLRLTLRGSADAAAALVVTRPALTAPQAAAREAGEGPQVVLVWLIDTLRADQLRAYNPATITKTPQLDAFAQQAAVFTRATVQGNSSLPSSASIFTGQYPEAHGIVTEKGKLKEDVTLLGEAFKAAGFRTGLFSSNGYVSKGWGFARGFDVEVNPIRESKPSEAEQLWPQARDWLKAQLAADPQARVFVYLNTSDPHVPYDPPADTLAHYHSGDRVGQVSPRGTGELLAKLASGQAKLSEAEVAYMRALYRGEITYNDKWFGTMREDLAAMGLADRAMVVVSSDHGEEFGEYGRFGHGISVNEELVDVPLIIGYAPWTRQGLRITRAVELVDLLPTLLEAVGARAPDSAQGESLVGDMLDESARHPSVAASYHGDFLRGLRVGDWKYHLYQGDRDPVFQVSYRGAGLERPIDATDGRAGAPQAWRMMRDLAAGHVRDDSTRRKAREGQLSAPSAARAEAWDRGW